MVETRFGRMSLVVLLVALVGALLLAFARRPAGVAAGSTSITDDPLGNTLTLRVEMQGYQVAADGSVRAGGLDTFIETPGAPRLPIYTRLVPVPEGKAVVAYVTPVGGSTAAVGRVAPAPTIDIAVNVLDLVPGGPQPEYSRAYTPDPAIYDANAFFPAAEYEVSEPFAFGDKQYVRVTLYPLRYNPVAREMHYIESYSVRLNFVDAAGRAAGRAPDNAELKACCGLLRQPGSGATLLPVGQTAYKIAVNRDGIYEITYADLQAAGFPVATANPNTFQMLTGGQAVAHQFIGNPNDGFQPGEVIRFYGWAYDGHRIEGQYITDNFFWLWAGGTPTLVTTQAEVGAGTARAATKATLTVGPDRAFYATYTDRWIFFPNQPDSWYWRRLDKSGSLPASWTFPITLSNPIASTAPATVTVEVMGWLNQSHAVSIAVNGVSMAAPQAFYGQQNYSLRVVLPQNLLVNGVNNVVLTSSATNTSWVYINRITAEYQRSLVAADGTLRFEAQPAGPSQFALSGFAGNPQAIWNISNRLQPVVMTPLAASFGATVNLPHAANAKFIAADASGLLKPKSIAAYNVVDIDPAGGADWVAVTHATLAPQAQRLAAHRADAQFGAHSTLVVDVQDVFNQYGYGLPTPSAIRAYMANAYANWSEPPRYLLLFGDGSGNPRQLTCPTCPRPWQPELVPTFLLFADRFTGQIPTDHPFALISGDDELPDIAVGRLSVETLAAATLVVDKIIQYDTNQLSPEHWMTDILFLSDDTDSAGNFCDANELIVNKLDGSLTALERCLVGISPSVDDATLAETQSMRDLMFNAINITGTLILNYRGHGGIDYWGPIDGNKPRILITNATDTSRMTNANRPVVFVTADCLDGHFAWNGLTSMSEAYLRLNDAGTAAHWSSTGLGYLYEYNVMHTGMYDGLFAQGMTTIGDAAAFAKLGYTTLGYNYSMAYAMTLQGDPAMQLMRPDVDMQLLSNSNTSIEVNETITYVLQITNNGIYPAPVTLNVNLPLELALQNVQGNVTNVSTGLYNRSAIQFNEPLGFGETETVTVTVVAVSGNNTTVNLAFEATSDGSDTNTGNQAYGGQVRINSGSTAVTLSGNAVDTGGVSLSLIVLSLFALLPLTLYVALRRLRR